MNTSDIEITDTAVGHPVYFDKCDDILPRAQLCNSIRFTQMLLLKPVKVKADSDLAKTKPKLLPTGFLILQPHALALGLMKPLSEDAIKQRITRIRQKIERSMPITSAVIAGRLPHPNQSYRVVNRMRTALLAYKAASGDLESTEKVIRAYTSFIHTSLRRETRTVNRVLTRVGSGFTPDINHLGGTLNAIDEGIREILDPGPSQPIDSHHPHIGLFAEFEQRWCHLGYTRGERVATIALAPGEELTLEVHSWIKETVKSERELVIESETRLSSKLNTRDHFEVANEMATKGHFESDAKINLSIPTEPVPIGVGGGTNLSGDLLSTLTTTLQRTTEQTTEAANTLRSTRKLRIEEARETGRDDKQLRKVVNTNRCHTLNVHYFEVLANYEVSLHLVEVRPCLLLPVRKPNVTPKWVLCHEYVLRNVLLDRAFLPGLDGAKTLSMQEQLEAMVEEAAPGAPAAAPGAGNGGSGIEAEMSRLRNDILDAFQELEKAVEDNEGAIEDLANINLLQFPNELIADVVEALSALLDSMPRLVYWGLLKLNADALSALQNLDRANNRPALEALRIFFAAVTPRDYQYNIVAATIAEALDALGIPGGIVDLIITGGLIDFVADDAGLYVAVEAAHQRLRAAEQQAALTSASEAAAETFNQAAASPLFTSELDGFTRLQLAEAKIEFERLKCHILNNCDHYFHAVWALEGGCQSLATLHGYEGLVSPIPIGFVGEKAAFPLLNPKVLETYFDPQSIQQAIKDITDSSQQKPITITLPTPGPIAEVTLGQCCGCEDYIVESRAIDLRRQAAQARQMEAEAERRFGRLSAGELEPFEPCCDQQIQDQEVDDANG